MREGAGPVVVLLGVLLGAGGLAWLLYEAGKPPVEPDSPPAEELTDPRAPARRVPTPPPPEPEVVIPLLFRKPVPVPSDALPRFPVEGHPELKLRNWKDVAAAFMDMLQQHRETAEEGMPTPGPEDAARMERIRKRVERLMTAALNRPAGAPEGARTTSMDHPAFAVNLAAAVLDRSMMPLSEAQSRRLLDLAVERGPLLDKADAAIADENDPAWMLDRIVARAHVGEAFYAELYSILTPAQGEALSPEVLRNRVQLDLASPAASWMRVYRMVPFTEEKQVVDFITGGLANQFKVLDRESELRTIVEAWAKSDTFPAADLFDRRGFLRTSHVAAAVPRMIDLLRRIVDGMKLDEDAATNARLVSIAYVPLRM